MGLSRLQVGSMETLNKSCLQKPKSQTYPRDKAFYRPHVIVKSAPIQQESYWQLGTEVKVAKESGRRLREWLKVEEKAIERKFIPANIAWM